MGVPPPIKVPDMICDNYRIYHVYIYSYLQLGSYRKGSICLISSAIYCWVQVSALINIHLQILISFNHNLRTDWTLNDFRPYWINDWSVDYSRIFQSNTRGFQGPVVENISKRCSGFLKSLSLRGCQSITDAALT